MRDHRTAVFMSKYAMPLILLALILLLRFLFPGAGLLRWDNLKTILLQTSVLGFLALGLSFVMIAGEADISFAGTLGMMSAVFTMLVNRGLPYAAALPIIMLVGMAIGLCIALLVTRGGFSAFIISIAFMFMGLGVERSFNEGITIWMESQSVLDLGKTQLFNVYVFTWVMLLLFALSLLVIRKTKYGFHLRITGENIQAGKEAGIKSSFVKITAFLIAGRCSRWRAASSPSAWAGPSWARGRTTCCRRWRRAIWARPCLRRGMSTCWAR